MDSPATSERYQAEHFLSTFRKGPNWFLYDFSAAAGLFRFVRMAEADFKRSVFLDDRIQRPDNREIWTPVPFADPDPQSPRAPLGMLFHTSFCGSTLFASALNRRGHGFALREPLVLWRLAALAPASRALLTPWVMDCLRRPLPGYRHTVIKPTNLVYSIAPELVQHTPACRSVVLFTGLDSFLVSCLKKGRSTHDKLVGMAPVMAAGSPQSRHYARFLGESKDTLLASATVFWDVQMRAYQHMVMASEHAVAVDFDQAAEDLPTALAQTAGHLFPGQQDPSQGIDTTVLQRNAKDPGRSFSPEQRRQERAYLERTHAHRLKAARRGSEKLFKELGPPGLDQPLAA